ncbi:MAG: class I SAM-dependent methyltransferase, partial [Methylococcaceae bacterium]|nr:class I SAM-dependent methyltransferase [Methylococcaceae bacterium]
MNQEKPPLDPHPLSEYVAWAGSRNREPLLGVLKEKLPKDPGNVLELASGSGMHINYFVPHLDHLHFHPSDKDIEVFDYI